MEENIKKIPDVQKFTNQKSFPKIKTRHIVIFLAICAILSVGSTTYLVIGGAKKEVPPQQTEFIAQEPQTPTPTVTPTPVVEELEEDPLLPAEPTPDTTAPVATVSAFVNKIFHYSFNYPKAWSVKKEPSTDPKILDYRLFYPPNATGSAYGVSVTYSIRSFNESLAIDAVAGEKLTISSATAIKKTLQDSNKNVSYKVIIQYGTKTITVFAKQAHSSVLDLILSSFKII